MIAPRSLILSLLFCCGYAPSLHAQPADVPAPRDNKPAWGERHQKFVEIANTQTDCEVLFLGDSITDYWRTKGRPIWDEKYAPLNAVNFGISGDRTQHLLWRLQNGEIGALKPKVIVMMIGTNNLGVKSDKKTPRNTLPEVVSGVTANVRYLREQLPDAKILLLGIFPRGTKDSQVRADVAEVNAEIAKLDDGKHVFFLDIGPAFLEPDGTLSKSVMPDLLHPNPPSYAIWAAAIEEPLAKLLR